MELKRSTLILTCLLSTVMLSDAKYHNVTLHNLTHVTDGSFFDPTVLKLRNQLLYISYPKVNADYRVKLESTSLNVSCEITIPLLSRNHGLFSPKVTILGNERLVVAFVEAAEENPRPYIRFQVLDPLKNCAYHANFSVVYDDAILWSNEAFTLIAYQDSFDVFAKSFLHCQPKGSICLIRYNDRGDSLATLNFDFSTHDYSFDLFQLYPVREFSSSDGYLVISRHTSNLTVVDRNLKVLQHLALPGFITAHTILNGDISVCYHVESDEPHGQCLKLDSRLKTAVNVSLTNSHYFVGKRLYNLADGSSLLLSASRGKVSTLVRRLSVDGRVSQPEIYNYECDTFVTDTQDRFIELKGGAYCFSFICKFSMITHCIKSIEAKGLSTYYS